MTTLAVDCETFLIAPGMPAPQSVCWAWSDSATLLVPWSGPSPYDRIRQALDAGDTLVGHNFAYDLSVAAVESPDLLPRIFEGLESGQLRCTMVREQLIRIARGEGHFVVEAEGEDADEDAKATRTRFDLASCSWRWLRHFVKKQDTWRKRYGELYRVPLDQWPAEAIAYPLTDVEITKRVYDAQQAYIDASHAGTLPDERPQTMYDWALKLISLWGVRSDAEAVAVLKAKFEKVQADAIAALLPKGIFRVGGTKRAPKFVKTMSVIRERVTEAYAAQGEEPPRTKKGAVSTATKTLREANHPDLKTLAEALGSMKLLSSFIPVLESGRERPICASYNVLVESGRTSCRKPNMQQLPKFPGVRETIVARPGYVFAVVDYVGAELVGQGQMCIDLLGFSVLAEQLNAGIKPMMAFAAKLAGVSYEEAVSAYKDKSDPLNAKIKHCRQVSKITVYGAAGAMQAKKLAAAMQAAGLDVSRFDAQGYLKFWESTYPEFPAFFRYIKSIVGSEFGDKGTITQLRSGRIRGDVDFPAAANSFFQGLIADAAKRALYAVVKETFLDQTSPMFGCRVNIFAHDEIVMECPESKASAAGHRLADVMIREARKILPDVKIEAEPSLMFRWSKDAVPVYREGELVPYDAR